MFNIKKFFGIKVITLMMIGLFSLSINAQNADNKPIAEEMIGSSGINWMPKLNYSKLELTIVRPDGTVFKKVFSAGSSPYAGLSEILGDQYHDGYYTYELVLVPYVENRVRNEKNSSYFNQSSLQQSNKGITQSGGFTVKGGGIVSANLIEPKYVNNAISASQDNLSTTSAQVFTTDLIVQASTCIGVDCSSSENFGFDTLRLKENNLRIKFDDTSNSGSFPNNDWQLTANESNNGGANKFSIDDVTNSKTPFTILANAPNNSIYVKSSGDVGFGTSSPVVDLHAVSGDTPTLRLEQNGSSGFTPQTWDIAGNETNFFVRDVTNGSELPFKILPGADDNSLVVAADGDVGLGTNSPSASLHIKEGTDETGIYLEANTGTNAMVIVERPDGARNFMSASGQHGFFGTESNHNLRFNANNAWRMEIKTDNSLEMKSGATCTAGGVWTSVSSREAKENIKSLSSDDAMKTLDGLSPVRFNYKEEKEEEYVGFIAEDVPELVSTKDRKHLTSMDIVAVLTKVVQEQKKTIGQLKKEVSELKEKIK